jgi:hypothetical protein
MPRQGRKRTRQDLANFSVRVNSDNFIANELMPEVSVTHDTDNYIIYNTDRKIEQTARSNGDVSKMITWDVSTSTYQLNKHSLSDIITQDDRDNTNAPLDLEFDVTKNLTEHINRKIEDDVAKLLFTTTTFGNNATLNTATSWRMNTTTSAPIQNILSASGLVLKSVSMRPNVGVCGRLPFEVLKENTNIHERLKYVQKSILTDDILASIFDLDKLFVGESVKDSTKEGIAASDSFIWGDRFLVAYIPKNAGRRDVTAALNFRSSSYGKPFSVKQWHDDARDGDIIEVTTKVAHKSPATGAGYLFLSVTASLA